MIRYALGCDDGHRFDSWFHDSAAFDTQAERGLVTCPICDSPRVAKAIMAPAVVARGGIAPPDIVPPATGPTREVALLDPARREAVRALREKITAETRDVGHRFAAEARRIHEADASDERIRGQATLAEARDLIEDGIMVVPLPAFPDDLN